MVERRRQWAKGKGELKHGRIGQVKTKTSPL